MSGRARAWLLAGLCALALGPWGACRAGSLRFCDAQADLGVAQKDRLLRFAGLIKEELDHSGQSLAIVSRSGLDLKRFGVRYSHAGISLKASANTPWSVRQLYYACDEHKPRIFDQGMSAFVLGLDTSAIGYISVVLLPPEQASLLESEALDNREALQFLSTAYSANAYPFSLRYQNCNQWVAELLAAALGGLAAPSVESGEARAEAQGWLKDNGYQPSIIEVGSLMWLGAFIPWVHGDDHPREDTAGNVYRVSMPASIEAFVHARMPEASRIEFCHTDRQVVIRRGWDDIAEGCVPAASDTVLPLD